MACKLRGHGEVPSYPSFSTRLLPSVQKRQCEDGHPCPVFALQVASHALEPICYQWRYWLLGVVRSNAFFDWSTTDQRHGKRTLYRQSRLWLLLLGINPWLRDFNMLGSSTYFGRGGLTERHPRMSIKSLSQTSS